MIPDLCLRLYKDLLLLINSAGYNHRKTLWLMSILLCKPHHRNVHVGAVLYVYAAWWELPTNIESLVHIPPLRGVVYNRIMAQDREVKHSTIYEEGTSVIARRRGCTLRLKIGLTASARHRSYVRVSTYATNCWWFLCHVWIVIQLPVVTCTGSWLVIMSCRRQ